MSSLTAIEKRYLEKMLDMGGGYVLDFTDATFAEFFNQYNVDIHSEQYWTYGRCVLGTKAKNLLVTCVLGRQIVRRGEIGLPNVSLRRAGSCRG